MRDRNISRRSTIRRPRATSTLLLGLTAVLAACGDAEQNALDPAGPFAQAPHDLIIPVAVIALAVFILVQGLIIYSVVKFRTRSDDDGSMPKQVHGNTRLEIVWTIIPALILAAIAVPTVQGIFGQTGEPEEEFLTVEVIGHRWWFEYHYPDHDIYTANELFIPVDTPVRLQMTSADPARSADQGVLHSFWIPRLAGKQDMVPGQTTYLNLQADEPGRYLGQCAEYCGLSHANMRARVVAVSDGDWQTWVDEQSAPAAVPAEGTLQADGRELFGDLGERRACASCHQVWEDGARNPNTGPDLTHLMSREEFAGAIHDMTEENLRKWLRDPNSMKAMQYDEIGIGMPNLDLSEDEIDALVAYLLALE